MDLAWKCAAASGLRGFDMGLRRGPRKGGQNIENAREITISGKPDFCCASAVSFEGRFAATSG
jgi:hypothetical protein